MTVADMKTSDASSVSMEENGADRAAADMAKASIIEKNSGLYRSVTIGALELPGNIFLAPAAGAGRGEGGGEHGRGTRPRQQGHLLGPPGRRRAGHSR